MMRRYRAPKALFVVRAADSAASVSAVRSHGFPFRVVPGRCFPALSLFPGHTPAQLARWPAVGKAVMSAPISAMITSAVRLFTPWIVSSRASSSANGPISSSIRVPIASIASSR